MTITFNISDSTGMGIRQLPCTGDRGRLLAVTAVRGQGSLWSWCCSVCSLCLSRRVVTSSAALCCVFFSDPQRRRAQVFGFLFLETGTMVIFAFLHGEGGLAWRWELVHGVLLNILWYSMSGGW